MGSFNLLILIGSSDIVTWMLILMNVLFFTVVIAYFILQVKKRGLFLHADYIKGTWLREGRSPTGERWHINYRFTEKAFEIKAIPEFHVIGSYKIIQEIENLLVVQLYDMRGDIAQQPDRLHLSVDNRSNLLVIDNRTFKRI